MANHLAQFASSEPRAEAANTDDVATRSSGNVYADLGFENPAEEKFKADLVFEIRDALARRRLSQVAAGRLLGLSQPDVSKLLRGRTTGYSLERLIAFTRALGSDVEITVRRSPAPATDTGKITLRVLESA